MVSDSKLVRIIHNFRLASGLSPDLTARQFYEETAIFAYAMVDVAVTPLGGNLSSGLPEK
jgi:hypothetical protein